jgi:hypothetical protein
MAQEATLNVAEERADLIRRANALTALRCYWGGTYRLASMGAAWAAEPREGGPAVTACSPAGLHWRLVARCGYVPSLAYQHRAGMRP